MSERLADGELITYRKKENRNEEFAERVTYTVLPDVTQLRILSFLSSNKIYHIQMVSFVTIFSDVVCQKVLSNLVGICLRLIK